MGNYGQLLSLLNFGMGSMLPGGGPMSMISPLAALLMHPGQFGGQTPHMGGLGAGLQSLVPQLASASTMGGVNVPQQMASQAHALNAAVNAQAPAGHVPFGMQLNHYLQMAGLLQGLLAQHQPQALPMQLSPLGIAGGPGIGRFNSALAFPIAGGY